MAHPTDVIIIGGGPVGAALAIDLAGRGIRVTVLERRLEPQPVPKGQNLTQRTVEHFRRWGLDEPLHAARTLAAGQPTAGLVAYDTLMSGIHYPWLRRSRVGRYYSAVNERLPQYETERVLRDRLAELPLITFLSGWTVDRVAQDADGVEVEAVDASGARRVFHGGWAVGCDGSRSRVREAAGITQTLSDHDRRMVLAVFRSKEFDRLVSTLPPVSFVSVLHPDLEGYWQFFGRVDASESWFFHAPVDPETSEDNIDIDGLLERASGSAIDVELGYLGFWDLRFALADAYRRGRILIAGDAAHSHPPYGGYGINTGFEDAVNLSWKLAATIQGWAGDDLLDSYDAERRPVFASTRDHFIERSIHRDRDFLAEYSPAADPTAFEAAWSKRALEAEAEVGEFAPNYSGSPIVPDSGGAPSALGDHVSAARAGHHLAPGLTAGGEPVFDALGPWFTLLVAGDAIGDGFEAAARHLGAPLEVLRIADASAEAYGSPAVLVRPDQFVAWAGDPSEADAPATLRAAIGAPGAAARP